MLAEWCLWGLQQDEAFEALPRMSRRAEEEPQTKYVILVLAYPLLLRATVEPSAQEKHPLHLGLESLVK